MGERLQLLIRFGYYGHPFRGLQPQKDQPTAGGALGDRLSAAVGERARGLAFAARTDSGVNALDNLATCFFPRKVLEARGLSDDDVLAAIAAPRDDGLINVRPEIVPRHVHARGCLAGKRYRYLVDDGCAPERIGPEVRPSKPRDARFGLHSWRIHPRLDVERLRAAAETLAGEHDFSSFRAAGCTAATPVKHLRHLRVRGPYPLDRSAPEGERRFVFELVGDAFVRKMVRNLIGTLVEIGTGWRPVEDAARLLVVKDRQQAGLTAPARGLTLVQVGCTWPEDGSRRIPELSDLSF